MAHVRTGARALAWLVAAAILVLPLVQPGGLLRARPASASTALSVTGSVEGLRPGVPAELVLQVTNASAEPVVVTRLTARVMGGGTTLCPASALSITSWTGDVLVRGGGSASRGLPVLLDEGAVCDGVTWSLSYEASGPG